MGFDQNPRLKGDHKHVKGVRRLQRVEGHKWKSWMVADCDWEYFLVQPENKGGKSKDSDPSVGGSSFWEDKQRGRVFLKTLKDLLFYLKGADEKRNKQRKRERERERKRERKRKSKGKGREGKRERERKGKGKGKGKGKEKVTGKRQREQ